MKYAITCIAFLLISFAAPADTGTLESLELNCDKVGVHFEDDNESIVLTFTNFPDSSVHSVIDIKRINDLEYKTRVMRYFGGLLVNNTFHFKSLVVVINGNRQEYEWNRSNISILVNKICNQALII